MTARCDMTPGLSPMISQSACLFLWNSPLNLVLYILKIPRDKDHSQSLQSCLISYWYLLYLFRKNNYLCIRGNILIKIFLFCKLNQVISLCWAGYLLVYTLKERPHIIWRNLWDVRDMDDQQSDIEMEQQPGLGDRPPWGREQPGGIHQTPIASGTTDVAPNLLVGTHLSTRLT